MSYDLLVNASNSVARGTLIYAGGEQLQSIALVIKGRIAVEAHGFRTVLGTGNFLGISDTGTGKHSFTYTAMEDSVLYGLPVGNIEQACLLLDEKQQYRGLLVTSLNFFINDLNRALIKLKDGEADISSFAGSFYSEYKQAASSAGIMSDSVPSLERILNGTADEYLLPEQLGYYLECCRIPVDAQKNYYGAASSIAEKHYREQIAVIPPLVEGCRHYADELLRYFRVMAADEKSLFSVTGKMLVALKKSGNVSAQMSSLLDKLLEKTDETEKLLIDTAGINPELDRGRMEEIYYAVMSDNSADLGTSGEEDISALDGAVEQIAGYAPIPEEMASEFTEAMDHFLSLTDKFARNPETNAIRKRVSKVFFDVYEAVLAQSFDDANPPLAIKLFLRYGFASEELLTKEELVKLSKLPGIDNTSFECRVYTLPEWLRAIYNGEKNPSKDEFDMDYEAHLRKEAQEKKLPDDAVARAFRDPEKRMHFEIQNLVRYADRVLNGNISAFVPVLCSEAMLNKIESAAVTSAALNAAVRKVERVDYSIFYKERMVSYEPVGVTHFMVVDRYVPDFILFPVYGRNGLMWQDMEGRRKQSHARMLLPILFEQDVEQEVLKLLSQFRWEKCKSEMGAQWNNYRYPSLTSEYTDYLQFYRKNNDLSIEKKEKVKAQLQQCNNRHRDVFSRDYKDWILRETGGSMRLNKVARDIMFTYCPMSSSISGALLVQAAYQEASRRYMTEKKKREKTVNNAILRFEKNKLEVPEEVQLTKKFLFEQ